MVDIPQIVLEAIKDSDALAEKISEIEIDLKANIQDELVPGHGYITGDLLGSIETDVAQDGMNAVIRAYSEIEYAKWVNDGSPAVEGKLMKMPWGYRMSRKAFDGYHFMEAGLEKTAEMYR